MEQFKSFQACQKTPVHLDKKFLETVHKHMKNEVNKRSYQNYIATGKIAGYIR